jgi:hypothetical protein
MFLASLLLLGLLWTATAQDGTLDVFAREYLDSPIPIRQMLLARAQKVAEKKGTEVAK